MTTTLTEQRVHELADAGNPLAEHLFRRLLECESEAGRVELLSRFASDLEQFGPAMSTLISGLAATLAASIGPAARQAAIHAMPIVDAMMAGLWHVYLRAGAPRGQSEQALLEWVTALGKDLAPERSGEGSRREEAAPLA